jgi:hypothetical protein
MHIEPPNTRVEPLKVCIEDARGVWRAVCVNARGVLHVCACVEGAH